jgi:acetate CoA/acetoacetate CoA-transferase alpha subunit
MWLHKVVDNDLESMVFVKPTEPELSLAEKIPPGASLLVGGFMGVGTPERLVAALVELGIGELTIYCNDTGKPGGLGIAPLIHANLVKRVYTSHVGTNPETQQKMIDGELDVRLMPQGTLIECIRAGGAGLGGVLTKTGLGTVVADGKQTIEIDGQRWLLEKPIRADFALLGCQRADYQGNLEHTLTATNFNPVLALAADTVIAEPKTIVPVGVISPDHVMTPGPLVDYLVAHPIKKQEK